MKPEDVDGELVDDAVDAWHNRPWALLDDQMRHILAAVLPEHERQVRAKVAEEIEARGDACGWCETRSEDAAIARGES